MTTTKQMQKLFAPLLEAFPDLVCVGRHLIFTPVRHFASGVMTDRTSVRSEFRAIHYVQPLFIASEHMFFVREHEFFAKRGVRAWNTDGLANMKEFVEAIRGPDRPKTPLWLIDDEDRIEEFLDVMQHDILPRQKRLATLEAGCAYWRRAYSEGQPAAAMRSRLRLTIMAIALGDFDEAAKRMRAYDDDFGKYNYRADINREVPGLGDRIMEQGNALDDGDRAALANLLRKWEEYTVTHLQLKKYWQPSPFPFEDAALPPHP